MQPEERDAAFLWDMVAAAKEIRLTGGLSLSFGTVPTLSIISELLLKTY